MTRIVTVSSGKGGVGKTLISVNLAVEAGRRGLRVCLFDADLGLANVGILLGLQPSQTLVDVIEGRCRLADILQHTDYGIDIIPGSSGVDVMANLPPERLSDIGTDLGLLDEYDLVVVDTASGVGRGVLSLILASSETFLVITPEPTSLTDAYGMVKLLDNHGYEGRLEVIVNQARTHRQAEHTFERFREVTRVYLKRSLSLLGVLPADNRVGDAVREQRPLLLGHPDSPAARRLQALAEAILFSETAVHESAAAFWRRYRARLPGTALQARDAAQPEPVSLADEESGSDRTAAMLARMAERIEQLGTQVRDLDRRLGVAAPPADPLPVRSPDPSPLTSPAEIQQEHGQEDEGSEGQEAAPTAAASLVSHAAGRSRRVRQDPRPSTIDGLQLRRILGRLLIKAIDAGEAPLKVETGARYLAPDNRARLIPGHYAVVSMRLADLAHPRGFIEDVFHTCDIVGCEIHRLGSGEHCWLSDDRDGCISLTTDATGGSLIQVFMPAGENALGGLPEHRAEAPQVREARPRLYRAPAEVRPSAWQRFRERHRQELVREEALSDAQMIVYRLIRYGRAPLFCGVMHGEDADEASPSDQAKDLGR